MITKHTKNKTRVMLSLFAIIMLFYSSFSQKTTSENNLLFNVEGTLTQSYQYCGGVHPTEEEEASYSTPKPYYSKIYLRKGKRNRKNAPIIDSTTTDTKGHYSISLPPGNYVILMPSQKDKKIIRTIKKMKSKYLRVNKLCLIGWWKGGLYKIKVKDKNIGGLDHQFHHRCSVPYPYPCIDYLGPNPA